VVGKLPDTAERRPLHTDGAPETTSPAATIHDPADIAALLELSAERDQWHSWVLEAERAGYDRGRQAGYDAGYVQAVTDWKVTAGVLDGGPSFAELDRPRPCSGSGPPACSARTRRCTSCGIPR